MNRNDPNIKCHSLLESGFVTRPIESGTTKYAEWLSESFWGLLGVDIHQF